MSSEPAKTKAEKKVMAFSRATATGTMRATMRVTKKTAMAVGAVALRVWDCEKSAATAAATTAHRKKSVLAGMRRPAGAGSIKSVFQK